MAGWGTGGLSVASPCRDSGRRGYLQVKSNKSGGVGIDRAVTLITCLPPPTGYSSQPGPYSPHTRYLHSTIASLYNEDRCVCVIFAQALSSPSMKNAYSVRRPVYRQSIVQVSDRPRQCGWMLAIKPGFMFDVTSPVITL